MKVGVLLVWLLSITWTFYIVYNTVRYLRLLSSYDNLFVISATVYKEPSPSISLLLHSRNGEIIHDKRLLSLVKTSGVAKETAFELQPGKVFLNDAGENLLIATAPLPVINEEAKVFLTVEEPKQPLLEKVVGRVKLQLSTRDADLLPRGVVTCAAPLEDELYPEVITGITTAIAYGSFVHIPHGTLQAPFFRVLNTFQKAGHARLSPWTRLQPLPNYDPNRELERNPRTAAFLDCFLLYRYSAQFLIFTTADSFVVPYTQPTYIKEFHTVFKQNSDRLLLYNIKRKRTKPSDLVDDTFYPSDKLKSIAVRGTHGNLVRIAKTQRMKDDEHPFALYKPLPFYFEEDTLDDVVAKRIPSEQLNLIDNTLDKIRKNPMFTRAWTILEENCALQFNEWRCNRDRCIHIYSRYESMYGAYFYNVHQSYKVSIIKEECEKDELT